MINNGKVPKIQVLFDNAEHEGGKSSRKGLTVLIQGSVVSMIVLYFMDILQVESREMWFGIAMPVAVAFVHAGQKYLLHKAGIRFEVDWGAARKYLPIVLAAMILGALQGGCATSGTETSISQTTPDGFTEQVDFKRRSVVTWGSRQDLETGDLDYGWENDGSGRFRTGGGVEGSESVDPVTETLARVIQIFLQSREAPPSTDNGEQEGGSGSLPEIGTENFMR